MYIDKNNTFSKEQPITVTAPSTNVIDTQTDYKSGLYQGSYSGQGAYGAPFLRVASAAAFTGAASVAVQFQSSDDKNFGSGITTHVTGDAITTPAAGVILLDVRMPQNILRYVRCNYVVTGGTFTTGSVNAFLALDVDTRI